MSDRRFEPTPYLTDADHARLNRANREERALRIPPCPMCSGSGLRTDQHTGVKHDEPCDFCLGDGRAGDPEEIDADYEPDWRAA